MPRSENLDAVGFCEGHTHSMHAPVNGCPAAQIIYPFQSGMVGEDGFVALRKSLGSRQELWSQPAKNLLNLLQHFGGLFRVVGAHNVIDCLDCWVKRVQSSRLKPGMQFSVDLGALEHRPPRC
jgi:hypothetical protein